MKKKNTKKKIKKSSRGNMKTKSVSKIQVLASKIYFTLILICLGVVFAFLVKLNMPIEAVDQAGLDFLNVYEYPMTNLTAEGCMYPYDVGDGVITFGPGLTYETEQQGFNDLNKNFATTYSQTESCIEVNHLFELQKIRLKSYENIVRTVATQYNIKLNQHQFNALVLLAYNSPNLFQDSEFINVIANPNSNFEEYVKAADSYYRQFPDYETKFGTGWYNRIVDSAQMYFYGDYTYQNI